MWKRSTRDPLARLLLDKYGLHVIARPRAGLAVFDIFPIAGKRPGTSGRLKEFLGTEVRLPEIREREKTADVAGTTSGDVSLSSGISFLEGFLQACGASGIVHNLSGVFARGGARSLRLRVSNATRDSVDAFALERALRNCRIAPGDRVEQKSCKYYIALAVHRSDKIVFSARNSDGTEIDLGADVAAFASANVRLEGKNSSSVLVQVSSTLAYGVELSELDYNERRSRYELAAVKHYVHTMGERALDLPGSARSMIGGPEDSMLLDIP